MAKYAPVDEHPAFDDSSSSEDDDHVVLTNGLQHRSRDEPQAGPWLKFMRGLVCILLVGLLAVLAFPDMFRPDAPLPARPAPEQPDPSTSAPVSEAAESDVSDEADGTNDPSLASWKRMKDGKQSWLQKKGLCYFDNILRRVNNRPGSPLTCYSACTGLNLHLRDTESNMQCVGWTLVRSQICDMDDPEEDCEEDERGSNVCLLHHTFIEDGVVEDKACWTGQLLKSDLRFAADTDTPPVTDEDVYQEKFGKNTDDLRNDEGAITRADTYDDDVLFATAENFNQTCPGRVARMGSEAENRPLRVFIGCLQASGCSLLSYLAGQRDRTTSLIDLGVRQEVPSSPGFYERALDSFPKVDTIVMKHSIRGNKAMDPIAWFRAAEHAYSPDVSFLFTRHPLDSYLHLISHISHKFDNAIPSEEELSRCHASGDAASYGLTCGTPDSKIEALEEIFNAREKLGMVHVTYEDICTDRAWLAKTFAREGVCIAEEDLRQPKWSIVDVMRYSFKYFLSGRRAHGGVFWGVGDLRNTFHDQNGDPFPESEVYKVCAKELKPTRRVKLLRRSVSPYREMELEAIAARVKNLAPNLYAFYESRT